MSKFVIGKDHDDYALSLEQLLEGEETDIDAGKHDTTHSTYVGTLEGRTGMWGVDCTFSYQEGLVDSGEIHRVNPTEVSVIIYKRFEK